MVNDEQVLFSPYTGGAVVGWSRELHHDLHAHSSGPVQVLFCHAEKDDTLKAPGLECGAVHVELVPLKKEGEENQDIVCLFV